MPPPAPLPIDAVLDDLTATLARAHCAVLVAPPGAGKTTRVPLAFRDAPFMRGKRVLMLEPRRIAARASAERMAQTLGERAGESVGYRVRFGSKISARTTVEIVTEGIFTRRIVDDPELADVGLVIFDEFHERSLDADLGLALARDAQTGLREDLRILVMSATLDGARVSSLLGNAPVITSEGRAFDVETRYVGRKPDRPLEAQMAETIAAALRADDGSVLAFLPGAAEIRRTESRLREIVRDPAIDIVPLFGALDPQTQDRAVASPAPGTRKIVLATSIAETSLTIDGVRIVVDCGLSRVPRYEPDVGVSRLETVRVSRAAADQRRGRAGRTAPGVCYRLWDAPQTASLPAFTTPEILSADLSSLALDLAQWGVSDPRALAFLDLPPAPAWREAVALLQRLDALDTDGRITDEGRALRALPLPPRLARMIVDAGRLGAAHDAAEIAAILTERGLGGDSVDLTHRLDVFRRDRTPRAKAARDMAQRWAGVVVQAPPTPDPSPQGGGESRRGRSEQAILSLGAILALAFPDRVAKNRGLGSFVLANGRGATMDDAASLARLPYLAVGEMTGSAARARILLAAPLDAETIADLFADRIESRTEASFDATAMAVRGRNLRKLDAITLGDAPVAVTPSPETARLLADEVIAAGLDRLPWSKAAMQLRERVAFLRAAGDDSWPDLSVRGLCASADDWLLPLVADKIALRDIGADDLGHALAHLLPWDARARIERDAPTHYDAPTGTRVAIDYAAEQGPTVSIRLQEMFGLTTHPSVANGRVPLVLELLSPAQRPVQVTRDLPGFWRGSYAAVRADLRGRYPRHPWPEDPAAAPPTRRVKPRGT